MKAWEIIAWTYEADIHCPDCARKRFGDAIDNGSDADHDGPPPTDNEGNEVHPMFASDETDPQGETCGTCGAEISEPAEPETYTLTVTLCDDAGNEIETRELDVTAGPDSVDMMTRIDAALAG